MNSMKWFASAAAIALLAGAAMSARAADSPHHDMFAKCAKACADCQLQCDMCFHHCADLVAQGKIDHVATLHTCVDCAECCKLCATLCARQSSFCPAACECCAKCCDECATTCEKFPDDKHMAACAKSCRDCAKECRAMIKHLGR